MAIIVTGASECLLGLPLDEQAHNVRRVDADVLFTASADTQSSQKIFWVYRAPWAHVLDGQSVYEAVPSVEKLLSVWLKQNRALLRNRRGLGEKLVLVNVGRNDLSAALLDSNINIDDGLDLSLLASRFNHAQEVERLLEACVDSILPEVCDVYEALEALAWTPAVASVNDIADEIAAASSKDLLHRLLSAKKIPLLEKQLEASKEQIQKSEVIVVKHGGEFDTFKKVAAAKEAEFQASLAKYAAEINALQTKSSANVEDLVNSKRDADSQVVALQEREKACVAEVLQLRIKVANLQKEISAEKKSSEEMQTTIESFNKEKQIGTSRLQEENDLLIEQMHELQEELERYYFENKNLQMIADDTRGSLNRARVVVSTLVERLDIPTPAPIGS